MSAQSQPVVTRSPVVVPKSAEAWAQEPTLRVEYLNRSIGSRCLVYFDDLAAASAFAAEHTIWGRPCVVQSKTMAVTHEVKSCAASDPKYVFWTKQFGDLESAREEFERGKAHAEENGGSFKLFEVGQAKPIASFMSYARMD